MALCSEEQSNDGRARIESARSDKSGAAVTRKPFGSSRHGILGPKHTGTGCNDRAVCKILSGKSLDVLEAVTVRRSVKFHHNAIESARVTKNDADSAGHV